ncbi:MAG: YfiR family protein [Planctomycetota bacterium]|jgi:hypothetical protein
MNRHTLTVTAMLATCWMIHLPFLAVPCSAAQAVNAAQTDEEVEYGVKAAFIYNFMKFIDWPAEKKTEAAKEQSKKAPMIIGVLGENPFGQSFTPVLDKTIKGQTIQLVNIESYQNYLRQHGYSKTATTAYQNKYQQLMRQCDILFVCRSEEKVIAPLLLMVKSHAVLTVSDFPEFAKGGGMIGFVEKNKKVRFEINLHAVTQENIKIRSQLLGLARKIYKDNH